MNQSLQDQTVCRLNSSKTLAVFVILILSLLCISTPLHAQWSEEGLLLTNLGIGNIFFEPDESAGVWIFYEDYILGNPRPKIQHVDASGNKLFGPEGMFVLEDTLTYGYIYGVQPVPGGDAIVVYDVWPESSGNSDVHTQRFTYTGSRLYSEPGVQITAQDWDVYRGFFNGSNVCGDGTDGIWVFYTKGFTNDLYCTGMNGDGSPKSITSPFITTMETTRGHICEDDSGGVYIITQCEVSEERAPYCTRIRADGTPVLSGKGRKVITGINQQFLQIEGIQDGSGGVIIEMENDDCAVRFQRIAPDLSRFWDDEGLLLFAGYSRYSVPPALMDDGSFVVAGIDDVVYNHKFRYGRISADGTELVPYADNIIDQGNSSIRHTRPMITSVDIEGQECPLVVIPRDRGTTDYDYYYTAHRMSEDGMSDMWADDPPEIAGGHPGYQYHSNSLLRLSDSTLFFRIAYRASISSTKLYNMYKIDPNELSSGVETPSTLPDHIEIISAYPNPFNSSVALAINLPTPGAFTVEVYDITGRLVDTIQQGASPAGITKIVWSPQSAISSGVYFLRVRQQDNISRVIKSVLLR